MADPASFHKGKQTLDALLAKLKVASPKPKDREQDQSELNRRTYAFLEPANNTSEAAILAGLRENHLIDNKDVKALQKALTATRFAEDRRSRSVSKRSPESHLQGSDKRLRLETPSIPDPSPTREQTPYSMRHQE
jgi:hypothetical protein